MKVHVSAHDEAELVHAPLAARGQEWAITGGRATEGKNLSRLSGIMKWRLSALGI